MKLTAKQVKAAKYPCKPLPDGRNLYLHVGKTEKTWIVRYSIKGKAGKFKIGTLEECTLAEARERNTAVRKLIKQGIRPLDDKRRIEQERIDAEERAALNSLTVKQIKDEWLQDKVEVWSDATANKNILRLNKNLPNWFLKMPAADVQPKHIIEVIEPIKERQAKDLAHRVKFLLISIFEHAAVQEVIDVNPASSIKVKNKMPEQPDQKAFAFTERIDELAKIIRAVDSADGDRSTVAALKLLPRLFCRPGELRAMCWSEIELGQKRWLIPAEKMKAREPHKVPLSRQVLNILAVQREYTTGDLVLPGSAENKMMSENTINKALRRLGFDENTITGHGFRHIASTHLHQREFIADGKPMRFLHRAIEMQLAHKNKNVVEGTYDHSDYWDDRVLIMQAWADWLDQLRMGEGTE